MRFFLIDIFCQCKIEFWGYFMEVFGFSGKMVVILRKSAKKKICAV
jgi:hypothetical protein